MPAIPHMAHPSVNIAECVGIRRDMKSNSLKVAGHPARSILVDAFVRRQRLETVLATVSPVERDFYLAESNQLWLPAATPLSRKLLSCVRRKRSWRALRPEEWSSVNFRMFVPC